MSTRNWMAALQPLAMMHLLALGLVAATPAVAQTAFNHLLTVVTTSTNVQISNELGGLAQDADPVRATAAVGANNAISEVSNGALRGQVFSAGPLPGSFVLAAASGSAQFTNNTAIPLSITGSGAPRLEVSSTFARSVGTGPGLAANALSATFAAFVLDATNAEVYQGFGTFAFRAAFDTSLGALAFEYIPQFQGGFSVVDLVRDGTSLSINIVAPNLIVAPGHSLAVVWNVSGNASGFSFFGAPGFSASTDFGNTAQMRMGLPLGWGLDTGVPLGWVALTPIPEPATAVLLMVGLSCVVLTLVRRQPSQANVGGAAA